MSLAENEAVIDSALADMSPRLRAAVRMAIGSGVDLGESPADAVERTIAISRSTAPSEAAGVPDARSALIRSLPGIQSYADEYFEGKHEAGLITLLSRAAVFSPLWWGGQ